MVSFMIKFNSIFSFTVALLLSSNHAFSTDEQSPPRPGSKRAEMSAENSPADNFVISKKNRTMAPLRENNHLQRLNNNDEPALCFSSMEQVIATYQQHETQYHQGIGCIKELTEFYQKHMAKQFDFQPTFSNELSRNSDEFLHEVNQFILSSPELKKTPQSVIKSSVMELVADQANADYVPPYCPEDLKKQVLFLNMWTQSYFSNMDIAHSKNTHGIFVSNYSDFRAKFTECFATLRRMTKFRSDVYKDAQISWVNQFGQQASNVIELQRLYSSKIEALTPLLLEYGSKLQNIFVIFQQSTGTTLSEISHDLLYIADLTPEPYKQTSLVKISSPVYFELFLRVMRGKNHNSFNIQTLNNQEFLMQEIRLFFQRHYNKTDPKNTAVIKMLQDKHTYPVSKILDFEIALSETLLNHQKNILNECFDQDHIEDAAALDEIGCDTYNLLRMLHFNIGSEPSRPLLAVAMECSSMWQDHVYKFTQTHNQKSNAPSDLKSGKK